MKKLDDKARKLAEDNIHLCYAFAGEYARSHQSAMRYFRWSMDDLRSILYVGLCKAARDYDPSKGCKFSTLAHYSFKHEIWKAARHNCSQRARLAFDAISIYAPLPGRDDGQIIDFVRADESFLIDQYAEIELMQIIRNAIPKVLSEVEREVLEEYVGGARQVDIAAHHGCAQAQISRIIIKSYNKLKEYFSTKDIVV